MCVTERIESAAMKVAVTQADPAELDTELLVAGLFEGGELPPELAGAPGAGDAKGGYKKVAGLHPEGGGRALVVGLGKRTEFDPEKARVAAAIAAKRAASLEAGSVGCSRERAMPLRSRP